MIKPIIGHYCTECGDVYTLESLVTGQYVRLTTDEPNGNYQHLHNCTTIIDKEVYLKDFDANLNLVDYCKEECKAKCNTDIDAEADTFAEYMDCDCVVARFYHMAVGHAELRNRLKTFEDIICGYEVEGSHGND